MREYLTWDDLADLYELHTKRIARILPMEKVFEWAVNNKDKLGIEYEEETGRLYYKGGKKNEKV